MLQPLLFAVAAWSDRVWIIRNIRLGIADHDVRLSVHGVLAAAVVEHCKEVQLSSELRKFIESTRASVNR